MARTIAQIQATIAADRAARPELAALNSPSATAIYALIETVIAGACWVLETLFDRHRSDVDAIVASAVAGTANWYAGLAYQFQLGDALAIVNNVIAYPAGTTGAKIVTRATAKTDPTTGRLTLKVAKSDPATAGALAPLATSELTQLQAYYDQRGFAGIRLAFVSAAADRLQIAGQIYYNALLDLPTVQAGVRAALLGYLATLSSGTGFDGLVYVARLDAAIQAVPGVQDLLLTSVSARTGALLTAFPRVYETVAGYIVEEDTPGLTFLDTLQFLPYGQ